MALHPDVLSCLTEGTTLYIRKAESDPVSELSTKLKTLNMITLPVLEHLLMPLKDGESNRQFARKMNEMGICMKNGKIYGNKLAQKLKHDPTLRVNKAEAKEFPLVKKCLVRCH